MKRIYRALLVSMAIFALIGCGGDIRKDIAESIANGVFVSDDVIAIPDNNAVGISSIITVDSTITSLTDMKVLISIEHAKVGDLRVYLKSPAGTVIPLSLNRGENGVNFYPEFDDSADKSIANIRTSNEPFDSKYRPEEPLSTFNGENPNGEWKLMVYDNSAGETGSLTAWNLFIFGEE